MIYNVAQLLMEAVGASRRYQIAADIEDIDPDQPGMTHIEGNVRLLRTPKGILAMGKMRSSLRQVCRRCLEPVDAMVVFELEEEFVPSIDVFTGATLPIVDDDEPELVIDEHHTLDLRPVLWQYVVASGTQMGLCRPDCMGLCPTCGQDLNKGPCGCVVVRVDPRLAVLADLLRPENDTESQRKDER